ncbi:MAG: 2-hydroxyacyl-CoA dehydratase [Planctomycetes bacterium]|nr:2-hydroxyacyl-CoA dehydratase [Planctomycetota bacterium]
MATGNDYAERVGITGTVPIEVLYAAGRRPLDLNNIFITGPSSDDIHAAESAGFPVNCCAWIKGLYGAARRLGIREVIGVAQGDCSNTHALMEVWADEGVRIYDFEYPYPPSPMDLEGELQRFCVAWGTSRRRAEAVKGELDEVRSVLREIDDLTWRTGQVSGQENHLWLIGASDFDGDPAGYERRAREFLAEASQRPVRPDGGLRLGYLGIPPICDGLYEFLESAGASVVFNEFQRQFAMLPESASLVEQYLHYTYPYGVAARIADIRQEVARRRLDGLIHYVQSFCFRHIQDRLIRQAVGVPVLTLEYDRPGPLDGRSRTRLEAFLELLDLQRGKTTDSA